MTSKSSDMFHLRCVEGFDGGLNQTFHIIVKKLPSGVVIYENSSLDKPEVFIYNLTAGKSYMAEITSYNKKGGSLSKHFLVEILQLVEDEQDKPDNVSRGFTGVTRIVICVSLLIGALIGNMMVAL